jgi:hypothetical protein
LLDAPQVGRTLCRFAPPEMGNGCRRLLESCPYLVDDGTSKGSRLRRNNVDSPGITVAGVLVRRMWDIRVREARHICK